MHTLKETVKNYGFIDKRNESFLREHERKGFSFDKHDVIRQAELSIVGQKQPVSTIAELILLWVDRLNKLDSGIDQDTLPRLRSFMLMGPTASGKTYILKTICKIMGFSVTVISCDGLTGAGWRGRSVENEMYRVAQKQQEDPENIHVVLFDEFDKMRASNRDLQECTTFNAQPNLLKLFDGGMYQGITDDSVHIPYELDTERVLFIFAGAFSGIGKRYIAPRLKQESYDFNGKMLSQEDHALIYSDDENLLRTKAEALDLLHWGIMSELAGRIGTIVSLPALTEQELMSIINDSPRSLQNRFAHLLPEHVKFTIDNKAAHHIAQTALTSSLGARALESLLVPYVSQAAQKCRENPDVSSVKISLDSHQALHIRFGTRRTQ